MVARWETGRRIPTPYWRAYLAEVLQLPPAVLDQAAAVSKARRSDRPSREPSDGRVSSSVTHLQAAYAVDVISAIVVAQVAAPAMRAAGFGTILVTGGGFADHPIPALATVSLGKAALRSAATMLGADLEQDGIRVAKLTIAGTIVAGTSFDPERIAERYWEVVHADRPWQAEFRFTGE